jgi:hypothetical protein
MPKWLDRLEDAGRKAVADSKLPRPAPKVERVIVTTRTSDPDSGDPGSANIGYYIVEDGLLTLTDQSGTPLKTEGDKPITAIIEPGVDPRAVAASLTYRRARNTIDGFNRRLVYPKLGLA